jgi:hypothetical protein
MGIPADELHQSLSRHGGVASLEQNDYLAQKRGSPFAFIPAEDSAFVYAIARASWLKEAII